MILYAKSFSRTPARPGDGDSGLSRGISLDYIAHILLQGVLF